MERADLSALPPGIKLKILADLGLDPFKERPKVGSPPGVFNLNNLAHGWQEKCQNLSAKELITLQKQGTFKFIELFGFLRQIFVQRNYFEAM